MYSFDNGRKKKSRLFFWSLLSVAILIVLSLTAVVGVRFFYFENLKPRSTTNETIVVTIDPGATAPQIAVILEEKGIIRARWAFEWYARLSGANNKFKAGTYNLSPALPVQDIVTALTEGKIATDSLTILPGKTLADIKATFRTAGYSEDDIEFAFDPANYRDHPALSDLPVDGELEGYLYPETFQKTADTSAETIVRQALDEMNNTLTPEIIEGLKAKGLTVHQGVTLASIVEMESAHPEDRTKIAQVYLRRLSIGMRLEADPTAKYGARLVGLEESVKTDTPYNTYFHDGLPPGPISNITSDSLRAIVYPADTDYLYFVASDPDENGDNTTLFSRTLQEHEALTAQYCIELCGQ